MRWQDWMNMLIGLWLIASPLLMTYADGYAGTAAWNAYLPGIGLLVIPLLGLIRPLPWREWLVLLLGLWLILAPFLFDFSDQAVAAWNSIISGILVVIGAAAAWRARGKGARGA